MASQAPRALLFDFDGLILDTESAIYEAWRQLYASHGHPLTLETWAQCVGSDFNHAFDPKADLERLTGQSFDWEAQEAALTARVHELLVDYPILPGVVDLLEAASAAGIPCAVASSSPATWVGPHLERLGLRRFFRDVVTRESVERIKPAPDLYRKAAERLGVQASEVVVLEDSLNGLRAALAAGMRCIVCPGPTTQHLDLSAAWRRVSSLAEIPLSSF
jgi:putative hydrolase of the HAD superfamily